MGSPKPRCCTAVDALIIAPNAKATIFPLGQSEKNSVRAYVFGFTLSTGHCSAQSALGIWANRRRRASPFAFQFRNLLSLVPKLYVVTIHQLPCLLLGRFII